MGANLAAGRDAGKPFPRRAADRRVSLPRRGAVGNLPPVPDLRRLLGIALALWLGWPGVAHGDAPPVPAGIADVMGARALSMGAYRGIVAGNDGIFLNSASLAARRRYSMETGWLLDRYGTDPALQVWNASVVDSQTAAFTSGAAYTRVFSGPWIGNLFHVPFAFALSQSLFLGVTAKWQSLSGPAGDAMNALNADASAFWASRGFGVGIAGYNLFPSGHVAEQPRALGVGVSYGNERTFHVSADWRGDYERQGKLTSLWAAGGELLLGDAVPVRAGYVDDETRHGSYWSVGAGLVSASGVAVDLAYRQCIQMPGDRTFAATLKLFLSSQ